MFRLGHALRRRRAPAKPFPPVRRTQGAVARLALATLAVVVVGILSAAFPETAVAQAPSPSVCDRTPAVSERLVTAADTTTTEDLTTCGQVTAQHLAAIRTLAFTNANIGELRAGDFNGLTSLTSLFLQGNSLTSLPQGIFDELTALTDLVLRHNELAALPPGVFDNLMALEELVLSDNHLAALRPGVFDHLTSLRFLFLGNNRLRRLPSGLFDNNVNLDELRLRANLLRSLPDRIFQPLTRASEICVDRNPGSTVFLPEAQADDRSAARGATVMLDATASGGPWGSNVVYAWEQSSETTVTLTGADTATPSFTAPDAAGEVVLTLTVSSRNTGCRVSDTVAVMVTVTDTCADSYNGALRLAGDNRQNEDEGRLEICYDDGDADTTDGDGWGAVCDDYWTDVEADVACRQLGYAGSEKGGGRFLGSHFGAPGRNVPIWLDNVMCLGNETSLLDCPRERHRQSSWTAGDADQVPGTGASLAVGQHNCNRRETVGVRCTETPLPHNVEGLAAPRPEVEVQPAIEGIGSLINAIDVVFRFDGPVTVDTAEATPHVDLRIGNDPRVALAYAGGTGSTQLLFRYPLPEPFGSPGTVRVAADSLYPRGSIRYMGTETDVALKHDAASAPPFVTSAPAMALVDVNTDSSFGSGDKVEVTLTFNEPVAVDTTGGTPTVELAFFNAQGTRTSSFPSPQAAYARGSGAAQLVFSYTMAADDGSPARIDALGNGLIFNGGTVRSVATGLDALQNSPVQSISTGSLQMMGQQSEQESEDDVAAPLTAELKELPEDHDGSTPFTFELHFSEAFAIGYETMRDHVLQVANGTVDGARRLDNPHDESVNLEPNAEWEITVTPTAAGDITILLAAATDCDAQGAACTADGRPLSYGLAHLLPLRPFTARFGENVPPEHDGKTAFAFDFSLNMKPRGLSYVWVRDDLFEVTGGSVKRASRLAPPANQGWSVRLQPDGAGDVKVTVKATTSCEKPPRVCAPDGRKLAGGLSATIPGPAALSVADAAVAEGPEATLDFVVTLSRKRSAVTTVDYETSDDTALAGADYEARSGTLTFLAKETEKTLSVPVLADAHAEDPETLTLTLSNAAPAAYVRIADGTATGTIRNDGAMPRAWLARFGRTVGSQVLEAVSQRLEGHGNPHLRVGGVSLGGATPFEAESLTPQDWLAAQLDEERQGQGPEGRTLTGRDLLLGSSFHLVSRAEARGGPALSAWGRVSTGGFQAEVDDVRLDGDVTTGFLGVDVAWERVLAGLLLARSEGDGAYRLHSGGDAGTVASTLTGVYPYVRLLLGSRLSLWGLAGVGSGDLRLTRANEVLDTDLGLHLGALGVRGALLQAGGYDLALKSDVLWVGTDSDGVVGLAASSAQVSRVRLILEGGRSLALASGATLTPTLQLGLRHDGGDAETGSGVEVGAGIRYAAGLLSVEGQIRTLLAHESGGYEEWGASGAIRLSTGASGLGPSLAVLPSWGAPGSAAARLWSHPDASALVGGNAASPSPGRVDAELGYGLPALRGRGVLTPYARLSLVEHDGRSWHLGARLALAESLSLSLEGGSRHAFGDTTHDLILRTSLPW